MRRASPIPRGSRATWPDLDLYHPWDLPVEAAIERGREAEAAALAVDPRITNSEGATVARGEVGVRLRQLATASAAAIEARVITSTAR